MEERLARYEELWAKPGFEKWLGNFHDIMTNPDANEDFAEFICGKNPDREVGDEELPESSWLGMVGG
jgi:hypothetical protein